MGAGAFHGRVRKGNGCSHPAITTRSAKRNFGLNLADLARFEKLAKFSLHFVYLNTSLVRFRSKTASARRVAVSANRFAICRDTGAPSAA